MTGKGFKSFDEFKQYCLDNRGFGLSVLKRTGLYTPFIFGDLDDLKPDSKIQICAGYYVIKELIKVLKPRTTGEYKTWRKACLVRDDLTCQECGCQSDLEVHHIEPVARKPKLATTISNGITLCKDCHRGKHG